MRKFSLLQYTHSDSSWPATYRSHCHNSCRVPSKVFHLAVAIVGDLVASWRNLDVYLSKIWNCTQQTHSAKFWFTIVCVTDHIFVLYHWKLLGATVSLGTKVRFAVPCAFYARLTLHACWLVRKQYKTESLTKTRFTMILLFYFKSNAIWEI